MRMGIRTVIAGFTVVGLTLGTLPAYAAAVTASASRPLPVLVVSTDKGDVAGTRENGADTFRGIPFAAPPVGALRWKSPEPAGAWSGVRQSESSGRTCPQQATASAGGSVNEDCLVLTVQRPSRMWTKAALPVLVYIHGGGLRTGSGSEYDGAALAAEAGIIVVTINYRVGVLGFLSHPALEPESGNYGLEDQQAALTWVHHNIQAFGGDPGRVTIAGQSAGAFSVCAHLASAVSRPLFSQAIMQSGGCGAQTKEDVMDSNARLVVALQCSDTPDVAGCLRATPVETLLIGGDDPDVGWNPDILRDTPALAPDPFEALTTGQSSQVPLLIGANRDEYRSFAFENPAAGSQPPEFRGLKEDQYLTLIADQFFFLPTEYLAKLAVEYPWPVDADALTASNLISAIRTDVGWVAGIGGCSNRSLTQQAAANNDAATYAYQFDHRTGPGFLPNTTEFLFGAGHNGELAYLFPSYSQGRVAPLFDAQERRLASTMKQWWGSFVRDGKPHADGQRRWHPYSKQQRTMSLRADARSVMVSDDKIANQHHCAFWHEAFNA